MVCSTAQASSTRPLLPLTTRPLSVASAAAHTRRNPRFLCRGRPGVEREPQEKFEAQTLQRRGLGVVSVQNTKQVYAHAGVDASPARPLVVVTWPGLKQTKGVERETTLADLAAEFGRPPPEYPLERLARDDQGKWKKPEDAPLFSMAARTPAGSRAGGGAAVVAKVHCAVFEHDEGNMSPAAIRRVWGAYRGFAYTTFNSTPEARRWRVVLELEAPAEAAEWPALWRWLNEHAGSHGYFLDGAAKDVQRAWWKPAIPAGAEYLFERLEGEPLPLPEPEQPTLPRSAPVRVAHDRPSGSERNRYLAALEHECEAVRVAPVGQRNPALNKAAYTVGGWVGARELSYDKAFSSLLAAITLNGGGGRDDEAKIASALKKGMEAPRTLENRTRPGVAVALRRVLAQPANDPPAWHVSLYRSKNGEQIRAVSNNLDLILRHDERLAGIARNEFRQAIERREPLPWPSARKPGLWRDEDDEALSQWVFAEYGVTFAPAVCARVVSVVALERAFSPVRDYLEALRWDGVARLDGMLARYAGATDSAYTQAIGAKWMISAAARAMQPGCQADSMLVLEGAQGAGKSSFFRILASSSFFTDDLADPGSKDAAEQLNGTWIVEMAELSSMRKADVETLKSFITRKVDRFRPAYARHVEERPRACIFGGTTNETEYLKDATGNRRFWPVATTTFDLEGLERDRDQLWAEAVHRFRAGEAWFVARDSVLWDELQAQQAERLERDAWQSKIEEYAEPRAGAGVSTEEILGDCLGIEPAHQGQRELQRVGRIIGAMGWVRRKVSVKIGPAGRIDRKYRYFPPVIQRE